MKEGRECMDVHLKRIADALLLNGLHCDKPGLLDGKMGIAIFFYHLGRKYRNEIYTQYAGELVDAITESLDTDMPVDFVGGLAGIGWGIGHLIGQGFIRADADEVLEEFDDRVFNRVATDGDDEVPWLVCAALYSIMRLSDRSPDASSEMEARLRIYAVEVLERLAALADSPGQLPGSQWLRKFRVEWPYPWLLYVAARFGELGIAADKVSRLKDVLSGYIPGLLQREMHPAVSFFLSLVLDRVGYPHECPVAGGMSYGWPESLTVRDGKAGLLLLVRIFAPGDDRYAPSVGVLSDGIDGALDGMASLVDCLPAAAGTKANSGLLDGIAGIGLSKIW